MKLIRTILIVSLATFSLAIPVAEDKLEGGLINILKGLYPSHPLRAHKQQQHNSSVFFCLSDIRRRPILERARRVPLDRELHEFTRADPGPAATSTSTDTPSTPTRPPILSTHAN
ncbi:hypothetical protein V8E53_006167 [Lactarius tabidus]